MTPNSERLNNRFPRCVFATATMREQVGGAEAKESVFLSEPTDGFGLTVAQADEGVQRLPAMHREREAPLLAFYAEA
ncbi:MAG: hypothetical protein H0U67_13630 [Gemmatimonadetes bacterium]|nr:hypothetical protein [Gemmatimonadota bacterium]